MNLFRRLLDRLFPLHTDPTYTKILGDKYYLGVVNDPGEPLVDEGPFTYLVVTKEEPNGHKQAAGFVFPNEFVGANGPWWITPYKEEALVDPLTEDDLKWLAKSPNRKVFAGIKKAIENLERPKKEIPANVK